MTTKILLFITILAYSIIVSQSFMYILSLKHVQLSLDKHSYTEIRKLIDRSMRSNFKFAIYAALLSSLALVIYTGKAPTSLLFVTSVIAFVAMVVDTILTVNGNLPINDVINSWLPDSPPTNWTAYRTKWFSIFQYRQIANITGFLSLLIGALFGTK